MVDERTRPPKRRKTSKGTAASSTPPQPRIDEVLAQTLTRFLHKLNENTTEP
ncbi:hypothetical protein ACLOJK_009302 [Asimina triloba]